MQAYVLANLKVGQEVDFFTGLGSVPQVRRVYYLFDDYEYLIELEGESIEELAKIATNHIRHLPGVERTAALVEGAREGLPCVERASAGPSAPDLTRWT